MRFHNRLSIDSVELCACRSDHECSTSAGEAGTNDRQHVNGNLDSDSCVCERSLSSANENQAALQHSHDIQDCLCAKNSMLHIRQHQKSSFITVDGRYVARPHLQTVSHRRTGESNRCEQR